MMTDVEGPRAPFVPVDWLVEHRHEVVLLDVRWYLDGRSGAEAFDAGHIPGARFLDPETCCWGPASAGAGRHPLPTPERFAEGMAAAGVSDDTVVVAYDDRGGVNAARLVWMLRVLDRQAALLDGGVTAWPGPLEVGPAEGTPDAAQFSVRPWPPALLADIDDAAEAEVLIDARDPDRFNGDYEPVDPRPGHIPNARNVPCRAHLRADGTLAPLDRLRRSFAEAGISGREDVVSYCGSGVTACHNLLVLEHVGLGRHRLYPGSYSQWSHSGRPVATDSP
jgi:thiosulfate/3-mercaptopyruvate sulfurtransferase